MDGGALQIGTIDKTCHNTTRALQSRRCGREADMRPGVLGGLGAALPRASPGPSQGPSQLLCQCRLWIELVSATAAVGGQNKLDRCSLPLLATFWRRAGQGRAWQGMAEAGRAEQSVQKNLSNQERRRSFLQVRSSVFTPPRPPPAFPFKRSQPPSEPFRYANKDGTFRETSHQPITSLPCSGQGSRCMAGPRPVRRGIHTSTPETASGMAQSRRATIDPHQIRCRLGSIRTTAPHHSKPSEYCVAQSPVLRMHNFQATCQRHKRGE